MEDEVYTFLSGLPLFSGLPKKEVALVADEITVKKYPKTTVLSVQGRTKLDCVYIIKEGRMVVVQNNEDGTEVELAELGPGECIGEMSLLTGLKPISRKKGGRLYSVPAGAPSNTSCPARSG